MQTCTETICARVSQLLYNIYYPIYSDNKANIKDQIALEMIQSMVLKHMGLDARKPVFGVCEQQRHRPACALCICTVWSVSLLFTH